MLVPTTLTDKEKKYMEIIDTFRLTMRPPQQSHFRVVCALVYLTMDNEETYAIGCNSEAFCLSNSICAERVAISQVRNCQMIQTLYLSTDATEPITPGTLCREFLASHAPDDLMIILGPLTNPMRTRLNLLYPYLSIYTKLDRKAMIPFAHKFISKAATTVDAQYQTFYEKVIQATRFDTKDALHPIRYAAGVLFHDGCMEITWQHKIIEFGASGDAVCKLIPFIKKHHESPPKVILQTDQFGVLHAPFAPARAYFVEYFAEYDILTMTHTLKGGIEKVWMKELVPNIPMLTVE